MTVAVIVTLALIVVLAYTVQTVAGFGAMLVSLSLGAMLIPIDRIPPLLVVLTPFVSLYVAIHDRKHIDWRLLLRLLLPAMLVGLVIGEWISRNTQTVTLKRVFGAMILLLACKELYGMSRKQKRNQAPLSSFLSVPFFAVAGIFQAIYTAGGPPLVYVLQRRNLSKSEFRGTLAVVWVLFALILIAVWSTQGRINTQSLTTSVLLLPTVPVGLAVGQILHHRVDEERFRIAVYILLTCAAVALLIR